MFGAGYVAKNIYSEYNKRYVIDILANLPASGELLYPFIRLLIQKLIINCNVIRRYGHIASVTSTGARQVVF